MRIVPESSCDHRCDITICCPQEDEPLIHNRTIIFHTLIPQQKSLGIDYTVLILFLAVGACIVVSRVGAVVIYQRLYFRIGGV